MRRQAHRPTLITDAPRSQGDELRSRQTRYVVMMLIRAGFLVLGGILISAGAPLLWLWLSFCVAGMVILPWLAVILANDGPPKEKHRIGYRPPQREEPTPAALPADQRTARVIDHEL